jgi:hypothetical protein
MAHACFRIQVLEPLTKKVIGTFEYASVPRIGDWFLTPDNDGSGEMTWVVDAVLHFPNYGGSSQPEIIMYGTQYKSVDLVNELEKKVFRKLRESR